MTHTDTSVLSYLMAAVFARDIDNGAFALCGMHSEIGLAACLLAQRTHAPDLDIQLDGGGLINPRLNVVPHTVNDWRLADGSEARVSGLSGMWNLCRPRLTFEFFGGLQIDQRGNMNLARVRGLRGPGGAAGMSAARYAYFYSYFHRHDQRIFVPAVDYVTVPGHLGGTAERQEAKLLGAGPRLVVTPLGVFDFGGPDATMRLVSRHEGVSIAQIQENTGFEVVVEDADSVTAPLTGAELAILRDLDSEGALGAVIKEAP